MRSRWYAVREITRVLCTRDPLWRTRRLRRLLGVLRSTLNADTIFVLLGVTALVVASLLWADIIVWADIIAIGSMVPVLILSAGMAFLWAPKVRKFSTVRILPFRVLTDDGDLRRVDPIGMQFAELLNNEIRRVSDLIKQEPFRAPTDVLNPASGRGETVREVPTRLPFKTGLAATGLEEDIKLTEVDTVTVGPFKVQLGILVNIVTRVLGRAIRGTLTTTGDTLVAVAIQSGHRSRTWTAEISVGEREPHYLRAQLARNLAHHMELERPGAHAVGADQHSFEILVDGLEFYRKFLHEGALQHLDHAELSFLRALIHSPRYAAAYHNLGIVKSERDRVSRTIGLGVSDVATDASARLWRQAVELDSSLTPARLQLSRAALVRADEEKDPDTKKDLLNQAVDSARAALEKPSNAHPMEGSLASYWLGISLLRRVGANVTASTKNNGDHQAEIEIKEAREHLRSCELDLRHEYAIRIISHGDTSAVRPLTERICEAVSQQAACYVTLADLSPSEAKRRKVLRRAEKRIRSAIGRRRDISSLYVQHGNILAMLGESDQAFSAYCDALEKNPLERVDLKKLSELINTNPKLKDTAHAKDLATIRAYQNPDDPEPWLMLAEVYRADDDTRQALALAGVALVLSPNNSAVYSLLNSLYEKLASLPDSEPWEVACAQAYGQLERHAKDGTLSCLAGRASDTQMRWACTWLSAESLLASSSGHNELASKISEIENLRSFSSPEMGLVSRQLGLLHLRIAPACKEAAESRRHLSAAVSCLDEAVRRGLPDRQPAPPLWQVELGEAQETLGDYLTNDQVAATTNYQSAIKNYTQVIRAKPKSLVPINHGTNRADEKLIEITSETSRLPTRARALAGRAHVHALERRTGAAVTDCREALHLAPLYAYPRFTLARVYRERAQYDQALQVLCRLVELLPAGMDSDRAHHELAVLYRQRAETKQGEEEKKFLKLALQELLEIIRNDSPAAYLDTEINDEIAVIYHRLGRTDEAIAALRATVSSIPRPGDARRHADLAHLLSATGQSDDAAQELGSALIVYAAEISDSSDDQEESRKLKVEMIRQTVHLAFLFAEKEVKLDEARLLAEGARNAARHAPGLDSATLSECEDAYGWAAYRLGRLDESIDCLEMASDHAVGNLQASAHLALALEPVRNVRQFSAGPGKSTSRLQRTSGGESSANLPLAYGPRSARNF